jgi:hypothetical protein
MEDVLLVMGPLIGVALFLAGREVAKRETYERTHERADDRPVDLVDPRKDTDTGIGHY